MRTFVACLLLFCALPFAALADPVNINTADAATLDRALKGVGPARAEAIVAYRKAHGAFRTAEQLAQVQGIGLKTVEKNRDRITVGAPRGAPKAAAAKPVPQRVVRR